MQDYHLPLGNRQFLNSAPEHGALLPLDRAAFLWRGTRRLALGTARSLASIAVAAFRGERDGGVVRDPVDPRSLGAVAAKPRQRRPERHGNLLKQIVARRRVVLVGPGQTPQRANVAPEQVLVSGAMIRLAHA